MSKVIKLIENEIQAKLVSDLILEIGKKLDESVGQIQNNVPTEEFENYREAVAKIMSTLFFEVMRPLYEEHPKLKPKELE